MKTLKLVGNIAYWLVLVVVVLFAGIVVLTKQNTPIKIRLFHVDSGSMTPTLPVGSLVVVYPQKDYQQNDIISFYLEGSKNNVVTHRVTEVIKDQDINKISYGTKGDANKTPDIEYIDQQRVIGKVIFSIPYLGFPMAFAKTQTGFIILIVIPATLIIYSEIQNIKKETQKMFKSKKKKSNKQENAEDNEDNNDEEE